MYKNIKNGIFALLTLYPVKALATETENSLWIDLLVSWGPLIILIAIYVFYMRWVGLHKNSKFIDRNMEHMEKVEKLLEKIANQNNNDK